MKSRNIVVALLIAAGSVLEAQTTPPASIIGSQRLRTIGDSLSPAASRTAQLGIGPGYTYAVTHRDSTGGIEAHADWTDMFVVETGSATLFSGGRLVGAREGTPGESRGGTIDGGTRAPLRAGDVVVIPAGTPHQMILATGERITYLAFKIAKPAK